MRPRAPAAEGEENKTLPCMDRIHPSFPLWAPVSHVLPRSHAATQALPTCHARTHARTPRMLATSCVRASEPPPPNSLPPSGTECACNLSSLAALVPSTRSGGHDAVPRPGRTSHVIEIGGAHRRPQRSVRAISIHAICAISRFWAPEFQHASRSRLTLFSHVGLGLGRGLHRVRRSRLRAPSSAPLVGERKKNKTKLGQGTQEPSEQRLGIIACLEELKTPSYPARYPASSAP